MTPPLHSHTHCQAAKANAQTKACQRVCLSNRTTKSRDKLTDEIEHRSDNITYKQAGVSCFVEKLNSKFKVQFFVGSLVVKNPCLRIAENRYPQVQTI
jgi:hypothetical protein